MLLQRIKQLLIPQRKQLYSQFILLQQNYLPSKTLLKYFGTVKKFSCSLYSIIEHFIGTYRNISENVSKTIKYNKLTGNLKHKQAYQYILLPIIQLPVVSNFKVFITVSFCYDACAL